MASLMEFARRLRGLMRRSRLADDLHDEIQLHVDLRQERLADRMPPDEARAAALRRFGNAARVREDAVDAWGWLWLEQITQDVRIGVRMLARAPAFALTAILTLALGIGANAAVFSVVSGVLLRPLPLAEPERLVQIIGTSPLSPAGGPVAFLGEFRRQSQSFDVMAGYEFSARYLIAGGEPEQVTIVNAEQGFFRMLGVSPLRGRTWSDDDAPNVAVIAERFWVDRLGGDPSIVGRTVELDGDRFTIVGVMPRTFQFPYRTGSLFVSVRNDRPADMWLPFTASLNPRAQVGRVTGRLKAGVSLAAAQQEMSAIATRIEAAYPNVATGRGIRLEALRHAVVSTAVRQSLYILFGAVTLVLALACANVANLSLVRVTLRAREVAVRSALGASRPRLVRQVLTESLVISVAGGVIGLGIGWWGTRQLLDMIGSGIPRANEVGLDWRVFLFLLASCTLTGIGAGIAPAVLAGRGQAVSVLQASNTQSTMAAGSTRLRDGLAIAEIAFAFILAVGAAVLIRELVRLAHTDSGMVTKNAVTFHVGHRMTPQSDVRQFYEIADRVAVLPGVRAAGFIQLLPLQNSGWSSNSSDFRRHGQPARTPIYPIELRYVTPGYFPALGIPVVRGRAIANQDGPQAAPVILINETLARKAFPGGDPIGIETTRGTIVGIVGDVRQDNLDRPALPEVYYPIAQNWSQLSQHGLTLIVSTRERPDALIGTIRGIIRDVNPRYAVFKVKTMDEVVAESLADFTLYLSLIAAAAGLALVLALTGTYGVVSYIATSRTREFAIRVALGADRGRVTRLVVGGGVKLTLAGLGLGLIGAIAGGGLLKGLPVTVRPPSLITTVPIGLAIALVAAVACLVPARRAAVSDPLRALRSE